MRSPSDGVDIPPIVEDDDRRESTPSEAVAQDARRPMVPAFAWTPTVARVLAVLFWIGAAFFVAALIQFGC